MYNIIDAHAHIYPTAIAHKAAEAIGDFYDIPMGYDGSVENLLSFGKQACVSRFLVHSVATSAHQVKSINRFILQQTLLHPEFIPFMTLHPDLSEEQIEEEIAFCIQNGFYGIKLHPDFQKFAINSAKARKIYDIVGERLPILLHTGDNRYNFSHPSYLSQIAKEYPHTRFIGAHFGGYDCWDKVEEAYKGLDNVFFDTCSSLPFMSKEQATHLIKAMGVDKFFFGTDFPMWKADEEIERFLSLNLTQSERENIFANNLIKFLGL